MTKILFALSLAAVLGACAGTPTASEDEFNRLAAQAENEIRLADKAGFLWRDTEKLLQDARAAQKAGQYQDAVKFAQKAIKQAQLAQQQARDNAKAGPAYPTNP